MISPSLREPPPTSLRRSGLLLDRTRAIPEISGPSGPVESFKTSVTNYENRYQGWLSARSDAKVALAAQREAGLALDQELRGVGMIILMIGRGRRSFGVYKQYFPNGYGTVLRTHPTRSLAYAAGILAAMDQETCPEILARREPLTNARALLESAVTSRQAAVDALAQAKQFLDKEKLAWRKAYNSFYFELRNIFHDRRSYVESLFRFPRSRRSAEEEQTEQEGSEQEKATGQAGDPSSSVPSPDPAPAPSDSTATQ